MAIKSIRKPSIREPGRGPFVGRKVALRRCEELLSGGPQVLYIYGGHGLGKTRLLSECAALAEQRKMLVFRLDAQCVRPSPSAVRKALAALPIDLVADLPAASSPAPVLLIIDSFESHSALEAVYWNEVVPALPIGTRILIAGQHKLAQCWPGTSCVEIKPLATAEVEQCLELLGVPEHCREMAKQRGMGIPLVLTAMAEFAADGHCPEAPPHVSTEVSTEVSTQSEGCAVAALLAHIMKEAPSDEHRWALWAAAMPQVLTERLLAAMLDLPGSKTCFRWLSSRPYVESAEAGLILHPSFREPLLRDLVSTHPDLHREYLLRAGRFHIARIEAARTAKKRTALMYTHFYSQRSQPLVAGLFAQLTRSRLYRDELHQHQDMALLTAMVERHEGGAASKLAASYLQHQPELTTVFRCATGQPQAFVQALNLGELSTATGAHDPAVAAALSALAMEHRDAKRPRRKRHFMRNALLVRFWMDAEGYQAPCCGQAEALGRIAFSVVGKPELSALLIVCSVQAIAAAQPLIEAGFVQQLSGGKFELDGRCYGLLGLDLTVTPVERWLRNALSHTITGPMTRRVCDAQAPVAW